MPDFEALKNRVATNERYDLGQVYIDRRRLLHMVESLAREIIFARGTKGKAAVRDFHEELATAYDEAKLDILPRLKAGDSCFTERS